MKIHSDNRWRRAIARETLAVQSDNLKSEGSIMEEEKNQGCRHNNFCVTSLISFLVGAALGVGAVWLLESKREAEEETSYGDADLFV